MMKRRLLAIGASLLLTAALLPTAWAAEQSYIVDGQPAAYASLADAAAAGASVQLTGDETVPTQILVTKPLTVDLNGHTLKKGSGDQAVFFVESGGSLTLRDSAGGGAIEGTDGATAVVTVYGGEMRLESGAIRGNTSTAEGGGIYVENGALTMTGGAVTGNTAAEGGGIYATCESTVSISGGEISYNTATSQAMVASSPYGGGGIAVVANKYGKDGDETVYHTKLTVSGSALITHNTAAGAGGGIGIRRGYYRCAPTFEMTGGAVTHNTAQAHEGGGIRMEGDGVIAPAGTVIRITDNTCAAREDLGGGGIFVVNSGHMTIHNAVIRNNTAGGLGGGVAGCIHGSIADLSATGAAIYGNTAQGVNFTQPAAGAAAADDKEIVQAAMQQGAFSAADAMDLFSAGNGATVVGDRMPGGGSHLWTGADGGTPVSIAAGSAYHSEDYLVLTAHPSQADKDRTNAALSGGKVLIEGNYAANHGGGVAVNGVLEFGATEGSYNVAADVAVDVVKRVDRIHDGTGATEALAELDGYVFELASAPAGGSVLAAAATDDAGRARLTLPADLFENGAGTYTFYLRERPGSDSAMTYDPTVYTVGVTVREVSSETVSLDNGTFLITIRHLAADAVTVTTADGAALPDDPVFTNERHYTDFAISGRKEVSTGAPDTDFTFQLLSADGTAVRDTASLTGAGSFRFAPIAYTEAGVYTYQVREVSGNAQNWSYDGTRYTVAVTVTKDAAGKLQADAAVTVNGAARDEIVFQNSYQPGGNPGSTSVSVRVEKRWVLDDGGTLPDSVTVTLLRGGKPYKTAVLSAENGWAHTWTGLPRGDTWTVEETDVPAGFTASVRSSGRTFTIVNDDIPEKETTAVRVDVEKQWILDDGREMPERVTAVLLRDGAPYETVTLSAENGWQYSWTGLDAAHTWTVEERDVPAGFAASVTREGTRFLLTNDDLPDQPEQPETPDQPTEPGAPGTPESPDGPKLPQTGQDPRPAVLLAAAGAMLMLLAFIARRRGAGSCDR